MQNDYWWNWLPNRTSDYRKGSHCCYKWKIYGRRPWSWQIILYTRGISFAWHTRCLKCRWSKKSFKIPPCLFVYSDSGLEIKVSNLSVQKSYIALFLQCNFDEVLITRTVFHLSYRNPVARIHALNRRPCVALNWTDEKTYVWEYGEDYTLC